MQYDDRAQALLTWLNTLYPEANGHFSLRPASSDASFRRYWRFDLPTGASKIAMDAPPSHERCDHFIHVADLFRTSSVNIPEIEASDLEQGFLVLTDFGTTDALYLNILSPESGHVLYLEAIDALIRLQVESLQHDNLTRLPPYDETRLRQEIALFPEWYIARHKQKTLSAERQQEFDTVVDLIIANNLAQPTVWVHRDYHSRNLMLTRENNPGILDFQDAVSGPITYDLVSLLKDAYIGWEEEARLDWVVRYWERAKKAGLPVNPQIDEFYRDFEWMGVQRHLKVLGIFARLNYRDGKNQFLQHVPLLLHYLRETTKRYLELNPLYRLLNELEEIESTVSYTF